MLYKIVYFSSDLVFPIVKRIRGVLDKCNTYSDVDFEYLFIVGGDGSFIQFAKQYAFENKKIIGINGGNVSFLSCDSSLLENLDKLEFENLELLRFSINDSVFYAVNDVYISGDLLLISDIFIDNIHLHKYRGTGLLFSSKLGSSALNKSFDGPLLFPKTNAWILKTIGSQVNNKFKNINNALVLFSCNTVKLVCHSFSKVYIDGNLLELQQNNIMEISIVKSTSKVLLLSDADYINKLKSNFL